MSRRTPGDTFWVIGMIEVLAQTGSKHYIKEDLQLYLPKGYDNCMRVGQFFQT
jgi:hypothetical protein